MADTAVARLRGILAATMTRTAIDQLLRDVLAEQQPYLQQIDALHANQPIPYTLVDFQPASAAEAACTITEDPDRNPIYTRACPVGRGCTYVTAGWDNAIAAEDQIRDHMSEQHQDVPGA